ncbi:MAG: tetratricopeptide repeat protein [bacterium]
MAKRLLLTILLYLFHPPTLAQPQTEADSTSTTLGSNVFALDGRAAGLGGSLVVQVRDASAVFWNPALLSGLKDRSLLLSVNDPFEFNLVSFTQFVPRVGTFGVSLTRILTSQGTVDRGNIAWGHELNRRMSTGTSFNLEKHGEEWAGSAGLGFFVGNPRIGTLENRWRTFTRAKFPDRLNFALMVRDIPLYKSAFETSVLLGLSYLFPTSGLLINSGYDIQEGENTSHLGFGLEASRNLTLFAGISQLELDTWAVGLGYTHDNFVFNLTYSYALKHFLLTLSARISPDPATFARPYYDRGTEHAKAGNYKLASKEFKKYLAFDLLDSRSRSVRQLVALLDRRIARTEMRVDSLFAVSKTLLAQEEPQFLRAALILTRIKELDPTNTEAGKQLLALKPAVDIFVKKSIQNGIDRFEANDYVTARKLFQRALMFEKNNATASYYISSIGKILSDMGSEYFLQGVGYYQQKNYARAKTEFERAIEFNSDLEEAQKYLRLTKEKIAQREEKVTELLRQVKVLEQQGKSVQATNVCLKVLELDKNNQQALEFLNRLRPKTARFVSREFDEAMRYYQQGNLSKASKLFAHILSIDPNHSRAKTTLAKLRQEQKTKLAFHLAQADGFAQASQWQRALEHYSKALTVEPGNREALAGRDRMQMKLQIATMLASAQTEFERENYTKAVTDYESILRLDPDNSTAKLNLRSANQKIQQQVETHFNKGINLYTRDKYDDAIVEFERVLALDPNHNGARDYIQQAEQRLTALRRIQPRQ